MKALIPLNNQDSFSSPDFFLTKENFFFETLEDYKKKQLLEILSSVQVWNTPHIKIQNFNPFIYKIINIRFPHLYRLELRQNKISSIQSFFRTDFPDLRELLLGKNFLTSIKDMRKNNQQIVTLDIDNNFIIDAEKLTIMKSRKDFIELDIEWSHCKQMCCDMRWVFKFQPKKMTNLLMRSPYRLKQPTMREKLPFRYDNIFIP